MVEEKTTPKKDKNEYEIVRRETPIPKDLHTLYMKNLSDMQEEYDFQKLYAKLLFSIDIGKDMLPDSYSDLRKETERILLDRRTYPGKRDIRIDSTGEQYQISSSDGAGLMKFRLDGTSEMKEGIEDLKTQQATMLIPRLRQIDSKIKRALQKEKIIMIKKPDIEEIFKNRILSSLTEKKDNGFEKTEEEKKTEEGSDN